MKELVLIRHGESTWWVDVGLTDRGVEEAFLAGRLFAEQGYAFDVAYTSLLARASRRFGSFSKR